MPSAGRLAITAARWGVLVVAFVTTAELFARLDDHVTWGAPMLAPYTSERLLVTDSLGSHGRPGYRYQKWRMNNAGFRGPDITRAPAPGVTRVAVLGASETFGLHEREGREYPARMQAILDSLAPGRYEVVNAGLPGMSLASAVPFVRNVLAHYSPELVLIYPSPSFYLEVTALPATYVPPRAAGPRPAGRSGLEPGALWPPRLQAKAREALKAVVPRGLVTWWRARKLAAERDRHAADWVWQAVPEDRMALLEAHLTRLLPAIRGISAEPVLVTHANRFVGLPAHAARRDRHHLVSLMAVYYPRASEQVMVSVDSAANAVIRRVARAADVPVVEAEGRIPPGSAGFADYAHFTDAGAEAMARLLASEVLRMGAPRAAQTTAGP